MNSLVKPLNGSQSLLQSGFAFIFIPICLVSKAFLFQRFLLDQVDVVVLRVLLHLTKLLLLVYGREKRKGMSKLSRERMTAVVASLLAFSICAIFFQWQRKLLLKLASEKDEVR